MNKKTLLLFGIAFSLFLISRKSYAFYTQNYSVNDYDVYDDVLVEEPQMAEIGNLTRGERNNNPGNLEKGQPWQGLAENQGGDSRFAVFSTPEYGIRALAKLLQNYAKQGKNTVSLIINKYAPSSENNTRAYVDAVSHQMGIAPTAILNLNDANTLYALVSAIINHENGRNIYADNGIIEVGIGMIA